MGTGSRAEQNTDDQRVLLTTLQIEMDSLDKNHPRRWDLQQRINAVIAQRFLQQFYT